MVEIRKATAADAEKILAYCRQIGGETDNLTFGAEGVSFTLEEEQKYLETVYTSDKQLYLVAVQEGEILGTGCFSGYAKPRLAHRGELSLSVKRSMWGNRIGTRLLEEIIRFARDTAKTEILSLEVRSDNARAIALYERFGFRKVGSFDGFMKIDGKNVSCDLMQLFL